MSKAIIFDTETTGLDPRKDEILTLSVIDGDGKTLWDRAYRPSNVTVWPQAEAVNHISPESVAMCPEICEDERELSELFSSADLIIGYNVKFDLSFLAAVGIYPREDAEVHDTMLDFAELYGVVDAKRHTWKWQKLTFAADHVGYDWGKDVAHGSLANARATLAVQQWCNRKCGVGVSEAEDDGDISREVGDAAMRQMRRDFDRIVGRKD